MVKNKLAIFILGIFLLSFISAATSLGTFKQNEPVNLIQNCYSSTSSNITLILYPNSTFALTSVTPMTKNGDNYNYTFSSTSSLGTYLVYGICDENGTGTNWAYDFSITPTGNASSITDSYLVFTLVGFALIMLIFGYSFSKDHWILKTFFNLSSAGVMVIAINTAKLISASNTNLVKMGNVGIMIAIVVLGIFFLYMFVYSFIEIIKTMKERGNVRWNY